MEKTFFDKKTSQIIKGLAIIMMFIHHILTFTEWWPSSFNCTNLVMTFASHFSAPTRLCISIFAFITGYIFCFDKEMSYKKISKRILMFLINYWSVLLILGVIYYVSTSSILSIKDIIAELIGSGEKLGCFCWYVNFYCISMLLLPFFKKLISYSKISGILFSFILPYPIIRIINYFILEGSVLSTIIRNLYNFFPCILIGVYFARYSCFERIDDFINTIFNTKIKKYIVLIILLVISFLGRYFCKEIIIASFNFMNNIVDIKINLDMLYSSMFIYCVASFVKIIKYNFVILSQLGIHSASMWFLHCVFFNEGSMKIRELLYSVNNPLIIVVIALVICYLIALLIDKIMFIVKSRI